MLFRSMLSLDEKLQLVEMAVASGFSVIELGSFVSPKAVPQLADTDELYKRLNNLPDIELRALIANAKGVQRAALCGCKKVKLNVSASRAHNLANLNKTPEESVAGFKECVEEAGKSGIEVSGSISMPFGSPWERVIPQSDVNSIIEAYLKTGISEISLSDASGMATPLQVYNIAKLVKKDYPEVTWWLHFHNTRGVALANILAAMEAGMTHFDTAFAGLGGCPFVPGAAGNIATEDTVHMLEEMGISTGIDCQKTIETAKTVSFLLDKKAESYLVRAGRNRDLKLELPTGQIKNHSK